jgi:mannose-6-phosphate isomerase
VKECPVDIYPYKFEPIYVEKIWGGRNLARLFARDLPGDAPIGESWELADLKEGVSVVSNGALAGMSLADLTKRLGEALLGGAAAHEGRFPLLLKLLDANDILSLQVHPGRRAVEEIGGDAALKTECWYVVESRDGMIYKGVRDGVTAEAFREAIENDTCQDLCAEFKVLDGDFHYLPAGTVHALGAGLVIAEVQTPSNTTYRVTDWGRGREIHVERSMQCIEFGPLVPTPVTDDPDCLLTTEFFTVFRKTVTPGAPLTLPTGQCAAIMLLGCDAPIHLEYVGSESGVETLAGGDTVLLPAALQSASLRCDATCRFLWITLPQG